MKPIPEEKRKIININNIKFETFNGEIGTSIFQLNPNKKLGEGFYIYKMEPGSKSLPHQHAGAEEFYILEGQLIDNDGTLYQQGDLVWLGAGTEHNSVTKTGCTIIVFSENGETPIQV